MKEKGIEVCFAVRVEESGTRLYRVDVRHHIEGSCWSVPTVIFDGSDSREAYRAVLHSSQAAIAEDFDALRTSGREEF